MLEYGSFCPVSKAAEILCERWTILVVREVVGGPKRFNEMRRGLPGCPPATLSKRLRELERAGVVVREERDGSVTYVPTEAGMELRPIVLAMADWGHRWVRSTYPDHELEPVELLWDVVQSLEPDDFGRERGVVLFDLETPVGRKPCWVVVEPGEVDLCDVDPRRPVDVTVSCHVRTLMEIWLGDTTFASSTRSGLVTVDGPSDLRSRIGRWIGQSPIVGRVGPRS